MYFSVSLNHHLPIHVKESVIQIYIVDLERKQESSGTGEHPLIICKANVGYVTSLLVYATKDLSAILIRSNPLEPRGAC